MPASLDERLVFADYRVGSSLPTNWYVGASSTEPNTDGTGFIEPVGGSYARVTFANSVANWPAAVILSGLAVKRNANKIIFPNPTGTWSKAAFWLLMLTSTGGTAARYWGKLDAEIYPKSGNTPVEFDVQQLVIPF